MKKILLATTALAATSGVAIADVNLTGRAEMGYFGGSGINESFHTDLDVTFTLSGETDGGLTFGATVDLDEGGDGADATDNDFEDGGASVFLSGPFGNLTLGDTDGAMDWALTEAVGNPGSLRDDETEHGGYVGGNYLDGAYDGQILRYDNTFGDFGFAVSVEADDDGVDDPGYGVGIRYNVDLAFGDLALGLAYQTADSSDTIGGVALDAGGIEVAALSAALTTDSGFVASIMYADIQGTVGGADADMEHYQISAGYSFDAFSIHANYGEFDGASNRSGYGLAAKYDLGGGASIHAGYGVTDNSTTPDTERWSFGVAMSF